MLAAEPVAARSRLTKGPHEADRFDEDVDIPRLIVERFESCTQCAQRGVPTLGVRGSHDGMSVFGHGDGRLRRWKIRLQVAVQMKSIALREELVINIR